LRDQIGSDLNIVAAGLLQDLALLQPSERSRFGYKRAAKALASGIDRAIADLIEEGTFREIPYVGSATERVAVELVKTGGSSSVDRRDRLAALGAAQGRRSDPRMLAAVSQPGVAILGHPQGRMYNAIARIAGAPADRVVNCWDATRFDAWLEARRERRTRRNGTRSYTEMR
jgi:hypothetical protein